MANYLLAYTGGGMAQTDAEREAAMAAWSSWFAGMGEAVVEIGNPFGTSATVSNGGGVSDGASAGLTGYSVLSADGLSAASELAKGCPVLASGGSVHVYEALNVM